MRHGRHRGHDHGGCGQPRRDAQSGPAPGLRIEVDNSAPIPLGAPGGTQEWAVRWTMLDRRGDPVWMVIRYDSPPDPVDAVGPTRNADGDLLFVMQINRYEDGDITSTVFHDVAMDRHARMNLDSDLHEWRTKVITYGEDRQVLTQTILFDDDSVRRVERHSDGTRVAVHLDGENFGGADNFEWRTKTDVFGSDGQIAAKFVVEDDGDRNAWYYDDGRVTVAVFEDVSDQHDWYARLQLRGEDGWDTTYFDTQQDFQAAISGDPLSGLIV